MPLDPKQIEELKRLRAAAHPEVHFEVTWADLSPKPLLELRLGYAGRDGDFYRAAHAAIPALLAEREEMLALLRDTGAVFPAALGWIERLVAERAPVPADTDRVAILRALADRLAAFLKG